ncbi:MAG: chemotaxis protein CheW [Microcystaceae cyanobacterium]
MSIEEESTVPEDKSVLPEEQEEPLFKDCWNQIGVMGDRTCPELKTVIHCYECPVYDAVGDSLLERNPPNNYLEDWAKIIQETSDYQEISEGNEAILRTDDAFSLIIFRLGEERLGLPVKILKEVTHTCLIQPIPHRSNDLFLGLVNIRGEMVLCASLSQLLKIEAPKETATDEQGNHLARMIVAGYESNKWVFPVDEIQGIFRFRLREVQDAPIVVTKAEEGYTKGIVYWEDQKVNYLDADLLFYTLNIKIF